MGPGAMLGASRSHLGASWALGSLLEASWRQLGPKRSSAREPWAVLKRFLGLLPFILGAKRPPKKKPRGLKIEFRRQLEPKLAKSQNLETVHRLSLNFAGPRSSFWRSKTLQHRSKRSYARKKRQQQLSRPSWRALGGRLARK